ncbi:MAG: hypothetical protein QXZ25_00335 [Candidatus Bathyarchaeia archaeon]
MGGLIIFALAALLLFAIVWYNIVWSYTVQSIIQSIKVQVPFIVAAIVFILIGLYMMKAGIKKEG